MIDTKKGFQLHDLLFFFLLVFSFYFTRNILCSLMMVLFFGYTVYQQIANRRKVVLPFFCVGFLIFILYGMLNIVLDNVISREVAQTMANSLLLNLLMIYAVIQYIYMQQNIPKILHIVELSMFVTTIIVVFLSLGTITEGRLASGTDMNANMLSMLCVYGFVLTLYLRKIKKITLTAYWLRVVIYVLSILLTGSRKGLIMVVLAIIIINLASGKRKVISGILIGTVVTVFLYLLVMNVDFLYNIIGIRVESLIILLTEGSTTEGSLQSRQQLIEIGMSYIEKRPWIGYGLDCFKLISGTGGIGNVGSGQAGYYSHNNYIELLFGVGIIGFILYYVPILSLLKKLFKTLKKNTCVVYLLAIFISKLAVEYAYVSYYSRIDAYIIAIILGCVLTTQIKQEKTVKTD